MGTARWKLVPASLLTSRPRVGSTANSTGSRGYAGGTSRLEAPPTPRADSGAPVRPASRPRDRAAHPPPADSVQQGPQGSAHTAAPAPSAGATAQGLERRV